MADSASRTPRAIILIGLLLTLVVPLVVAGPVARHIPGLSQRAGQEAFWWSLATIVLLFVLAIERRPLSSVGFRRPDWRTLAFGFGGGIAVLAFAGSMVIFLLPTLHLHQDPATLKRMLDTPYWYRVLVVTRAAFCEELLMRGYGIERLRELSGSKVVAGFVTLAIFTLAHWTYGTIAQLVVAASAGLVLTLLYLWRRDLISNMIAHWITDGVTLLLQ